jgi:subtilisin family serine protease
MKRLLSSAVPIILLFTFSFAGSANADLDFAIKLKTGAITPNVSKISPAQATALTDKHVLVQFDHPLTQTEKDQFAANGIELLDYVPEMAYTARLTPSVDISQASQNGLRWLGAIDPSYKISPRISDGIPSSARRGPDKVQLVVVVHKDENPDLWAANFQRDFGAEVIGIERSVRSIEIIVPEPAYNRISELDAVTWIEPAAPEPEEHNNSSRVNIGADVAQAAPYNLTGSGVTVAEWDGGRADPTHPDLAGRVTSLDGSAVATHSTHVAGTVLGTGASSGGVYKGMAPEASLVTQQWWSSASNAAAEYSDAILYYGATISTNSWGYGVGDPATQSACEGLLGNYFTEDATLDNLVRGSVGRPITIVWSAGNQRGTSSKYCGSLGWTWGTMDPLACSKNVISIGAINSNNSSMTSFSSWGPTDDGRLKPDVVGPGCQSNDDYGVTSCRDGGGYTTMCGTSMSAPAVAGVVALMRQAYSSQFSQTIPLSSTFKGVLINTAVDLGAAGPDYANGNGKVDAGKACKKIAIGAPSWVESQMGTGDLHSYDLTVPGGTPTLKVTLAWDDPGGTAMAGKDLINDLDLTLVDPFGVEQLPWVLDPASPSVAATKGVNRRDNVETVEIASPAPGLWKARVNGYNIPVGPQKYSLIFTPDSISTPGNVKALAVFDNGDKTINPGNPANVRFWAVNIGAAADSVRVRISDTRGWLTATVDTVVYLTSYDSASFSMVANVPSGLSAGENTIATCSAVSRSDAAVSAQNQVVVTVAAVQIVDVVPPANDTARSPEDKTISVTVQNQGNASNTVTVTPSDQRGWVFRPVNRAQLLTAGASTIMTYTVTIPAEEPDQTINQIKLMATSTGGATDSAEFALTVYNPLFPPTLIAPSASAYTQSRRPTFEWSHSTGTSYSLLIARDSMLNQAERYFGGLADTFFTIPTGEELADGGYFWSVRMYAGGDSSSLQRYPRHFVVDNVAPAALTTVSPVSKYDTAHFVTYILGGSTGPTADTVAPEYNVIEVSRDSTFTAGTTTYQPVSDLTFQSPDTLPQGRFFWRVKRIDQAGNSSGFSPTATYVHDTKAPAIPTVVMPTDGRHIQGATILFRWTTGTPPPYEQAPQYYFVHVSNKANFSDYSTFADFVYADSLKLSTAGMVLGTHYYWRLKALDSAGFFSDYGPSSGFDYKAYVCGDVDQNGVGPDISDLSRLVDYLFLGAAAPPVPEASSFDCNLVIDISDLTALVDFLFASGPPLCCP